MLQPTVSQNFNGTIWRMEIDDITGTLILEIRNAQERQISYSSISITGGSINFKDRHIPERWLNGIEAVHNGILLMHYYSDGSGPEHKGIIALNAVTGEDLWTNYTMAFDHLTNNGLVVFNTSIRPKKLLLADIRTGEIKRAYDHHEDKPIINRHILPYLKDASHIKEGTLPAMAYGNLMHYLEYNNYRIVSLHTLDKEVLQQHLYIMNGSVILYHDLLNTHIQKLQPEAFVLYQNALLYIKNKTEIIILNL